MSFIPVGISQKGTSENSPMFGFSWKIFKWDLPSGARTDVAEPGILLVNRLSDRLGVNSGGAFSLKLVGDLRKRKLDC